uniref:Steroid 5-alpha reductase C-terminal domain-containing protein n=1 Tax=Lotharella globosa TaxID=91324 RepID=A0A7S3ZC58_9EUKA|mmetsp:Transcript_15087/g.28538  ORF Transcript_15087/g.28538 Transcript_15087/m.28538 type:complete len:313 (+) Transcript_15087:31-969(+)
MSTEPSKQPSSSPAKVNVVKLYLRGCVSNGIGLAILFSLSYYLGLQRYVLIAGGIQLLVFVIHGLPYRSEKFYDLSGSFTHLSVVASSLIIDVRKRSPRQVFAALAAVVWMSRLGTFLYARILRDGRDVRFDALKPVWLSFMGAWTIQAVWVSLVELPVVLLNDRDDNLELGIVDLIAMGLWILGFLLEAAADSQKMAFRDKAENKGRWIRTGLWRYSRHPNYFGEILMWGSLSFLSSSSTGFSASTQEEAVMHFAWLSPLFTAFLLLLVTGVPMVEKAGLKKWGSEPEYVHYMKNTSCLLPWFPAPEMKED